MLLVIVWSVFGIWYIVVNKSKFVVIEIESGLCVNVSGMYLFNSIIIIVVR